MESYQTQFRKCYTCNKDTEQCVTECQPYDMEFTKVWQYMECHELTGYANKEDLHEKVNH